MITYSDLLASVNLGLKNNFPDVNRVASDIKSGFKKPAFFTQLSPITENDYNDYSEKLVMINIHYFSELKTNEDIYKIFDKLNKIFKNKIKVNDRILTLEEKSFDITDNVLQFKFTLDFIDTGEYIEVPTPVGPIYIPEHEMTEELGYTADSITVMQELEIEESEGD